MIARRQQTSASLVKACDASTVICGQPIANLYGEQPELIEVAGVERAEYDVVALRVRLAIACRYLVNSIAVLVLDRCEMVGQ